jgi:hypothetical protein
MVAVLSGIPIVRISRRYIDDAAAVKLSPAAINYESGRPACFAREIRFWSTYRSTISLRGHDSIAAASNLQCEHGQYFRKRGTANAMVGNGRMLLILNINFAYAEAVTCDLQAYCCRKLGFWTNVLEPLVPCFRHCVSRSRQLCIVMAAMRLIRNESLSLIGLYDI